MKNSEVIDNPDYYELPRGHYLEDFIWAKKLDFATGSALKYAWRAGNKDGEAESKDEAKRYHYCAYIAWRNKEDASDVMRRIDALLQEAEEWNGNGLEDCIE